MDKNISSDERKLFGHQEKQLEKLIADAAKTKNRTQPSVSEKETDNAFRSVAHKTGIRTESGTKLKLSGFHYAAAAVFLLFAVGIAYLLTPNKIETGQSATRIVELPDETTVILSSGSTLTYSRFYDWGNRSVMLSGEAFFEVTKTGEPFKETTKNARITVLGTKFNVHAENGRKTIVYLKEGKVSFAPKNRQEQAVILEAGQLSLISEQHPAPLPPKTIDQSKVMGWLQKQLSFKNQSLSDIFEELENRYDVEIKSKADQILKEKLTIYISNPEGIEQTLNDICRAKGLQYLRENDTFTVFKDS